MRAWALWIVLIVAVLIVSLAGWLALGTFLTAQSICPDGFECEDARVASLIFFGITAAAALVIVAAWRGLGSRSGHADPR